MDHLTTKQLLPTIIIATLLGFFLIITFSLFIWHRHRYRALEHEKQRDSPTRSPTFRLTLRDGKIIPYDYTRNTVSSKERYSVEVQSIDLEKHFDFDVERGFNKPTPQKSSGRTSRHSFRSTRRDRGQTWTPGRPPWLQKPPVFKDVYLETEQKVKPPTRPKPRDRSRSIPRPSLINIERRGSSQTWTSNEPQQPQRPQPSVGQRTSSQTQMTDEMKHKRPAIGIVESLSNAYNGRTPWIDETHHLPSTHIVTPDPVKTVASSTRKSGHRWSIPTIASLHSSIPTSTSAIESSRAVSLPESIQPPLPLFFKVSENPHDSFVPDQEFVPTQEVNRRSFLTMTESPTSSTSTERAFLGPKTPLPLAEEMAAAEASSPPRIAKHPIYNEQSRPLILPTAPSINALEVVERVRAFGRLHRDKPNRILEQQETSSEAFKQRDKQESLMQQQQHSASTPITRLTSQQQDALSEETQHREKQNSITQQGHILPETYSQRSSISSVAAQRPKSRIVSKRPPSIEIDIPHIERGSLAFFTSSPTPTRPMHDLRRGPSVMSNRSGLTIASSEISSNWTIGKAELVNIYPSLADEEEEEEEEGVTESFRTSQRVTPPYAKTLKSKYGQYPKGQRDKALPTLPKSPLSQFPPGF